MPFWSRAAAVAAITCGLLTFPAAAGDAVEWHSDYAAARKEAEQKKLPLLVVVGTENCVYCRKMEATTFNDPAIRTLLRGEFVALKLDAGRHPDFAKAMRVTLYPTAILASAQGEVLAYLQGYLGAEDFKQHASRALANLKRLESMATKPPPNATAVSRPGVGKPEHGPREFKPIPADPAGVLAAAQQAYRAERFGDALEQCELLLVMHKESAEAVAARKLAGEIRNNSEKLRAAELQLDERNAATYLALAESWQQQGQTAEAIQCLEKALKLSPNSKAGEVAKLKLQVLQR